MSIDKFCLGSLHKLTKKKHRIIGNQKNANFILKRYLKRLKEQEANSLFMSVFIIVLMI